MPYSPKPPPRTNPEFQDLYDYIEQELQSISRELLETQQLELRTTNSEPDRPREGMIAQADGTNWNPGEGVGTYKYESGTWKKFGDADHTHVMADVTDAGALAILNTITLSYLTPVTNKTVVGRNSSGNGVAEGVTLTQLLDWIGSAAQGDLLYRGASVWARLAAGTSGQYLKTQGAGANPLWADLPASGMTLLATLATTSGTSKSTGTLDLTPYKFLYISFTGVSGTNPAALLLDGQNITLTPGSSSGTVSGYAFLDLQTGICGSTALLNMSSLGSVVNATSYSNSTTVLVFSPSSGAFDAGTIKVYGVP